MATRIDADGVERLELCGELDLGAAAVGAGDEDGVLVVAFEEAFVEVQAEEAGEATGVRDNPGAVCAAHDGFKRVGKAVFFVEVDARRGVGEGTDLLGAGGGATRGRCLGHVERIESR